MCKRLGPFTCGLAAAILIAFAADRADAVYGQVVTQNCSDNGVQMQEVARWGRVASRSAAFATCLDAAMRSGGVLSYANQNKPFGPYRPCRRRFAVAGDNSNQDPFYSADIDTQIAHALEAARSANDFSISCSPGSGTSAGGYYPDSYYSSTASEVVHTGDPIPYPTEALGESAAGLWHEAIHDHGYQHGYSDGVAPFDDAATCGYPSQDPNYNSWKNALPYVVGSCMSEVLHRASTLCGSDFATACPNGGMSIVNDFNDPHSQCVCVDDHRDPYSANGYVCQLGRGPKGADPKGGGAGFLYTSINDAPNCAGNWVEDGYIYSTGASYSGPHWSSSSLYSEAALGALHRSLQKAARGSKSVRLSGTREGPHFQLQSVMVLGQ